ncbi:MAG: hypothetical protein ACREBU_09850, partial [Nitrososphaera sp.]
SVTALKLVTKCKRCDYENSRDSIQCDRCGFDLDAKKLDLRAEARARVENILDVLANDPQKLQRLIEML